MQDLINTVPYHFNCSTLNRTRKTSVKGKYMQGGYFKSRVCADAMMLSFKRSVVALMSFQSCHLGLFKAASYENIIWQYVLYCKLTFKLVTFQIIASMLW